MRPLFLAAALLVAAASHAQGLILRPAAVPLAGRAGQSVTQQLTLENTTGQALDFVLEARDVVVRDGARVFLEAGRLPGSIAATAVFEPARITVPAGASGRVSATFTVPPQVQQRAVVAQFRALTPVQAGQRPALLSLATLFTFQLGEEVSVRGVALEATPPSSTGMLQLRTALLNDGREPVVPSGMAVLLDGQGRVVGKAAFAPRRLLPGERLTATAEYDGELAPGNYRAVATFDVAGRPLTLATGFLVP